MVMHVVLGRTPFLDSFPPHDPSSSRWGWGAKVFPMSVYCISWENGDLANTGRFSRTMASCCCPPSVWRKVCLESLCEGLFGTLWVCMLNCW